jgi:hypothetical protein
VNFDFPKRAKDGKAHEPSDSDDQIAIVGYEEKVHAARLALISIVKDMEKIVTKELDVDPRIHARIIGGRGAGIKSLQEKFKVRVNFPRDEHKSSRGNERLARIISVSGEEEGVEDAAAEILMLADEFVCFVSFS